MRDNLPETRPEIAAWLGISQSTLRSWDARFRPWLEAEVGEKGKAVKKKYPPGDLVVFQTIARLRDDGLTFEEIEGALDDEIASTRLDTTRAPGDGPETGAPAGGALVAYQERERRLIAEIGKAEGRLEAAEAERERLEADNRRLQLEIDKLRERAAAAETRAHLLEQRPPRLLERIFRRRGE